ncbi:hypothetical protein KKF34_09790 [Myxococcota bacterium]|nr:hypothetical protein [Myxococcota bacterium]MBU1380578.1 hypothetical protein [Myxococcota bacterium]MBU1497156.1 hypothetical protein [Myxococcota bacterium]
MPVNIYNNETHEQLDCICDNDWNLTSQIEELAIWLKANSEELKDSNYLADIGFVVRKDASGGGAVLSVESIRIMSKIGMELFLSEYRD